MSRTLEEQIANTCIHFDGVSNPKCKAGIVYMDVYAGNGMFPCLNTGGTCDKCQFPTAEEVSAELSKIGDMGMGVLAARAQILDHVKKTGVDVGQLKCVCGGQLFFRIEGSRGHIRAKCNGCGIAFME